MTKCCYHTGMLITCLCAATFAKVLTPMHPGKSPGADVTFRQGRHSRQDMEDKPGSREGSLQPLRTGTGEGRRQVGRCRPHLHSGVVVGDELLSFLSIIS